MEEKILIDRIKLKLNLAEIKEDIKEIKRRLKENGTYVYKVDVFKNFYMIKKRFFNIYYYPAKNYIMLDFNMQRYFSRINMHNVANLDALKVIRSLNSYMETIGVKKDVREWEVFYVEFKKDLKYKDKKTAKMVIENFKKCTKGNLKAGEYNTSYYRYTKNGNKINVYLKEEEVKAHKRNITAEELTKVHNVVRIEVAFGVKKLRKTLGLEKVLLRNILSTKTQEKLYNNYFLNLGFTVGFIPTKNNLFDKIKQLNLGRKKTENLIKFVEAVNKYSFKKVKEMFPCCYSYLKILKKNGLPVYYLNAEEKEVLKGKIAENKEKTPIFVLENNIENKIYNIYSLFNRNFIFNKPKLE